MYSPGIVIWMRDLTNNKETKIKVNYNTTSARENDAKNRKTRQNEKHLDKRTDTCGATKRPTLDKRDDRMVPLRRKKTERRTEDPMDG